MSKDKGPDHSRRKERSRQAILAATRALVAEEPYEKVTLEAIAARAGVGKQTIYRRWPSKSAVVVAALLEEFADPSFDKLIRALNTEIANDAALAAEYREKLAGPLDEAKKKRLRSAQKTGQLAADADLDLVLDVLYAPLFLRWLHRSGPLTTAYADSLVDATLRAFGP
jgi:AcrR family transcriptional regulator